MSGEIDSLVTLVTSAPLVSRSEQGNFCVVTAAGEAHIDWSETERLAALPASDGLVAGAIAKALVAARAIDVKGLRGCRFFDDGHHRLETGHGGSFCVGCHEVMR